ncbi:uncharacterized protein cobll1a isoform X2 [Pimephales promelas]|uniref:uncharacterized protein cobll1a isoform X2 n=1 Tax=Pimephales promelas TaxID=90988 RepID=UPI001955A52D|nr:uncharacterized protein cobll1a isoform X2 [Pimephales promelas]KAG1942412.1 cordon-bleu protein-like [Pimephales promelas]KAG1942413.1 cordon-bleu protein-like [Pimephales promelas]KAG1942414.1 cordon-bleu protein-like [Pimephales promelas]KAG1942415.1 cordon-bleu protein-like [Pimephales promelas]KAG1942416.1 cordon-bleu protein-like [Pimephales promelas]
MDPQEDLIDRDIPLTVLLPGGQETTATVHGSKPVMDVLVALCAQHHLVPSDHVIKLFSTNQNYINFKPNSMIGSLEFERVVLQSKESDANKKKPHIPVATVRLLINYKMSFKAVARVNPSVPLIELMPTVCEKCEFNPDATVLLKTYKSEETLDLTKTLNDYGIRELYAKEMKVEPATPPVDPVSTHKGGVKEKSIREKENKGFFGLFKKSKKTHEQAVTDCASTSLELNGQCSVRVNGHNGCSTLPMVPADMAKKRPAPKPPMTASQSVACGLHTRDFSDLSESDPAGKQDLLSPISSTESTLKRTKRRAPPPPGYGPAPSNSDNKDEAQADIKRSDKHRARIADQCPAITKVMSELAQSLKTRRQRMLSSENSPISQNQPAEDASTGLFSEHHTPEAELKALPGCQLLRSPFESEGLTTFTVVPLRRQQSRRCLDLPLALQSSAATKDLSPGDPDAIETHTTELLEKPPSELFRDEGKGSDKSEPLSGVIHLQHLEKENQACKDIESENLELKYDEDQCIHESLESLQRGLNNPEHLDHKMNNLELRDRWVWPSTPANELSDRSPINPNLVEREEMEEQALVETEEETDWVEQYKERRRKFLDGDNDGMKLFDVWGRIQRGCTNLQEENTMQEMGFPSPPPPVYWDEKSGDYKEEPEIQSCDDQWSNFDLSANSKPEYVPYQIYPEPRAHSTQTNPNADTPGAENNCNFTPEPHKSLKSHSSFDPCSPAVSLFALAVFQKANRSKLGLDPTCS